MASRLAESHIVALARLRGLVARGVSDVWSVLPGYDEEHVELFLRGALPIVLAGRRNATALTDGYLARAVGRRPFGVEPPEIRGGVPPEEVYRRPFVTVWSALGNGTPWDDAVAQGLSRAASTAEMDVQLSFRAAANEIGARDDGIYGFQRVADGGACAYCLEVDGAYVKSADASPLHNRCGCGLEPLTEPHPRARWLPDGASAHDKFAVHEHGELGSVLTDPAHDFTSAADALH